MLYITIEISKRQPIATNITLQYLNINYFKSIAMTNMKLQWIYYYNDLIPIILQSIVIKNMNKYFVTIYRKKQLSISTINLKKLRKKIKKSKKKLWRIWVNCTWCNILGIALDTNPHFSTIFGHFINLYKFFIAPNLNYHFNTIFNHFINLYKFFIRKTLQSIILKGPFQNKNILTIKKLGSWSAKGVALTCVGEEAFIESSKELTLASPLS